MNADKPSGLGLFASPSPTTMLLVDRGFRTVTQLRDSVREMGGADPLVGCPGGVGLGIARVVARSIEVTVLECWLIAAGLPAPRRSKLELLKAFVECLHHRIVVRKVLIEGTAMTGSAPRRTRHSEHT